MNHTLYWLTFVASFCCLRGQAQDAASYFHNGANLFIKGKSTEAKQTLLTGLARYPNDPQMRALLKEIKEDEQKDQQQKDQQQSPNDSQKKKDKQQQQQQQEPDQEEEQPQQSQPQPKNQQEQQESPERVATTQKLKQMNLSEEKAKMILDAMKSNETQYLQQRRREKTQKTDRSKPDW